MKQKEAKNTSKAVLLYNVIIGDLSENTVLKHPNILGFSKGK